MLVATSLGRNSSRVIFCKCGVKTRFVVAKSENNRGRLYYGCLYYKKVSTDEELHEETLGLADDMEILRVRKQSSVLEQKLEEGKLGILTLQGENNLLRRMVLGERIRDNGMVVDGELVFRSKDVVVKELRRVVTSLRVYKLVLYATWVMFAIYWAVYKM